MVSFAKDMYETTLAQSSTSVASLSEKAKDN